MINKETKSKIIVALDVQEETKLNFLLDELQDEAIYFKVGMEAYYHFGPSLIDKLKSKNYKVFLDLKMHDIPNTVAKACKVLGGLGVDILNVHAAGGVEMMAKAQEAFYSQNKAGILIAVTQLTSTSQEMLNNELHINEDIQNNVIHLAQNTKKAGLAGVVCSPLEVVSIKEKIGSDFKCITPGIRPKDSATDEQVRIQTPSMALKNGSDYLVIGRAITNADSPRQAFQKIIKDVENE